jgi:spore coat protein U-like protein
MFHMPRKHLLAAVAGGAILAFGGPSEAVVSPTASTTFQVTATVQATCLISASNLAFGTYTGAQVQATSTISITCTSSTPYNVGLDPGTSTGASVSTRKMSGPTGSLLPYALFRDSAYSNNWGNTVGTDTEAGTGNGSVQTLTVYGQLASGQYVIPGSYVDTITATVTY